VARSPRDRLVDEVGRDVVVITFEAAGRNAERRRELVQFVVGLVADQMRPEPTGRAPLAGPDRIVDIDHE
jgi:hypothetical protein